MAKKYLKPRKGLKVWHPIKKRHIKAKGEKVEMSSYFIRREREGDFEPEAIEKKVTKKVNKSIKLEGEK